MLLPMWWHDFANAMAQLCQYDGTTLPMRWQKMADAERETA
ncbi:hypothetical protein [Bacteroides intestinalis]|jgi:hypothetical protein|nr:hypothetical protein [Bacteroides intestinalis]